jgi:hypothetical protein
MSIPVRIFNEMWQLKWDKTNLYTDHDHMDKSDLIMISSFRCIGFVGLCIMRSIVLWLAISTDQMLGPKIDNVG